MPELFNLVSAEVCRLGFCDDIGLTIPGYLVLVLIPALLYIIFTLLNILKGKPASTAEASFDIVNEKIDERFEEINQLIEDKYEEIKEQIDEIRTAYEELLEDKFAELAVERTTHRLDMLLRSNKFINNKYEPDGKHAEYSVIEISDDGHLTSTTYENGTSKVSSITHVSPIIDTSFDAHTKILDRNEKLNQIILGEGKKIIL
jgi:Mg2+ and Co2+ transporter CorA